MFFFLNSVTISDFQKLKNLNLDVALVSFLQVARHWQDGEAAKLEITCQAGSLNIQLNTKLRHPDLLHFHHPSASPPLYLQESMRHAAKINAEEAKSSQNISADGHCS